MLITSIFVFAFIPDISLLKTVLMRLLLLPVVAGIAFEILKWAGANRDKQWAQALIAPGLWTQLLTTRIPDDTQIEVAIAALDAVWTKEHDGAGLAEISRAEYPAIAVA